MAQGSIRIRCRICRKSTLSEIDCKIHKYPDRVYQARIHNESGTFASKGEADIFLAKKRIEHHKNPDCVKKTPITFAEMAEGYLEEKRNSPRVSVKAWTNYESTVRTHLLPAIGLQKLSSVTPKMVQDIRNSVQGKSRSIQQKVSMRMNAIFRKAVLEAHIHESPSKNLDKLPPAPEITYNILEPQQIIDLLAMPTDVMTRLYYKLPIFAGLRAEEAAGLMWDCIHFDKREVEVKRVLQWLSKKEMARIGHTTPWIIRSKPKTHAGFRRIPINDDLIKDLQIHKIEQVDSPYNLVFTTKKRNFSRSFRFPEHPTPISSNVLNKEHFKADAAKAGIPAIKYHELRHTFCSLLAAAGVDMALAQYYMGHSRKDARVTLGIYTHVMEHSKRMGSQVAQQLTNLVYGNSSVSTLCPNTNQNQLNTSKTS